MPLKYFMGIYKTYRNQPSHVASPVAKKVKRKKTEQSKEDRYNHLHNGEVWDLRLSKNVSKHITLLLDPEFFFKKNLPAYDLIYIFFNYLSVTGI